MLPGRHRMSLCLFFFFFCFRSTCAEALPAEQPRIKTRHEDFTVKQWTTKKKTHEHLVQSKTDMLSKTRGQHAKTLNQLYILQIKKKTIQPHERNKLYLQELVDWYR